MSSNAPYGTRALRTCSATPLYKMAGKSGTAQVFTVGDHRARAQGRRARRAFARSRVVRRVRAGRCADDRSRSRRRERAGRRLGIRGADRATHSRPLPADARAMGRAGSEAQASGGRWRHRPTPSERGRMNYDALDTSRTQRTLTGYGAAAARAASGRAAVHRRCACSAPSARIVLFSASGRSLADARSAAAALRARRSSR